LDKKFIPQIFITPTSTLILSLLNRLFALFNRENKFYKLSKLFF
jgi:hypothetical protein